MSLHQAAQHLASRGRGEDSLLIHMTPREVAGLDALARRHYGSGLTTNPDTGLPEAGLLGSLLPAIAGIGLSMTGVGAPMAAMMVGGGTALATGSLQKGLMAGLGAFGGAGIGEGLAGMGSTAAASSATAAAAPSAATTAAAFPAQAASAMPEAAMGGLDGIAGDLGTGFASQAVSPAYANSMDVMSDAMAGGAVPAQTVGMPTAGDFARYDRAITPDAVNMSQADKMKAGLGAIGQPGSWDSFIAAQGGNSKAMMNGMMAFGPALTQQPRIGGSPADNAQIRPYDYDPRTQRYTARAPVRASEFRGFAAGGQPDEQSMFNRYTYDPANQTFTRVALPAPTQPTQSAAPAQQEMGIGSNFAGYYAGETGAAAGGLAGLLRGPGDGVSDSIPATINGQQPAAIADGEYIVPARVVSELGNGSSDAGARRLDEMVARVQRARSKTTGSRKAVAADSGAHQLMPA